MNDQLTHYGVKGQRWGVITKGRSVISKLRNAKAKRKENESSNEPPKQRSRSRVSSEINSVKRQLSWNKKVRDRKKLTDEELNQVLNRIKNENNLRRLAKRKEYVNRDRLSDEELSARVNRLQLEDNLKKNVNVATKTQREIGKLIVTTSFKVAASAYDKKKGKTHTPAGELVMKEFENYINGKNKTAGYVLKIATDSVKEAKKQANEEDKA